MLVPSGYLSINGYLFYTDLVSVVNHVKALEQFCVLMMMGYYVSVFLELLEDGKLIPQKWLELKNLRLGTGFEFAPPLLQLSMDSDL